MPRILRTRESRCDYDEIWSYIATRDLSAADRLIRQFDATLSVIAAAPNMGRKVEDFSANLRSLQCIHFLKPSAI